MNFLLISPWIHIWSLLQTIKRYREKHVLPSLYSYLQYFILVEFFYTCNLPVHYVLMCFLTSLINYFWELRWTKVQFSLYDSVFHNLLATYVRFKNGENLILMRVKWSAIKVYITSSVGLLKKMFEHLLYVVILEFYSHKNS